MKIDCVTTYFNRLTEQLGAWFLRNPKKETNPIAANSQFSNGSLNASSLHSILPNSSTAPAVYPLNNGTSASCHDLALYNSSTAPAVYPLNNGTSVSCHDLALYNSSTAPAVYPLNNGTSVSCHDLAPHNSSTAPDAYPLNNGTSVSCHDLALYNSSTAPAVYPSNNGASVSCHDLAPHNSSTAPAVYPSNDKNVSHDNSSTAYPDDRISVSCHDLTSDNSSTIPEISSRNTSRVFTPDPFKPFNPSSSSGFNSTLVSLNSEDRSSAGSSNHTSLFSSMAESCSSLESNSEQKTRTFKIDAFYRILGQKLQNLVHSNRLERDATNSFAFSNRIVQSEICSNGLLGPCPSNNLVG